MFICMYVLCIMNVCMRVACLFADINSTFDTGSVFAVATQARPLAVLCYLLYSLAKHDLSALLDLHYLDPQNPFAVPVPVPGLV